MTPVVECLVAFLFGSVVGLLMQRYTLHEARPVDLFPHTPHVETVVLLSNKEVDDTISTTV